MTVMGYPSWYIKSKFIYFIHYCIIMTVSALTTRQVLTQRVIMMSFETVVVMYEN